MTTSTVEPTFLEDSIILGMSNLRRVLKDRVAPAVLESLIARFDRVKAIAPYNSNVTRDDGRMALQAIVDCAAKVDGGGRGDCNEAISDVVNHLWSDIQTWWRRNDSELGGHGHDCINCGYDRDDCIGRWESRGGKYWVELRRGRYDYHYRANNAGGGVCSGELPITIALQIMQVMLDKGRFLPDNAKTPMKLVV